MIHTQRERWYTTGRDYTRNEKDGTRQVMVTYAMRKMYTTGRGEHKQHRWCAWEFASIKTKLINGDLSEQDMDF